MNGLLNLTVEVKHVVPLGNRKFGYPEGAGTLVPANIQPASNEEVQAFEGQIGQLYACYVDGLAPVKEGDRVTSGTSVYEIRGIKEYAYGSLDYKKLILSRDKGEE